jgi:hypothetical protein
MGQIPEAHRAALRTALDDLVAGRHPELLTWVKDYGESGTELIAQPDDIWEHPWTDYEPRDDGSAYIVFPLWTRDESPSDLSAVCELDASGRATGLDVHVL